MSALVLMAGSGSRFSVKASSFESGEKANPPPPSREKGGTSWGSLGVRSRTFARRCHGDEEQMRALVAGEVVPVAVEEMGEDLGFDFAVGLLPRPGRHCICRRSLASAAVIGGQSG